MGRAAQQTISSSTHTTDTDPATGASSTEDQNNSTVTTFRSDDTGTEVNTLRALSDLTKVQTVTQSHTLDNASCVGEQRQSEGHYYFIRRHTVRQQGTTGPGGAGTITTTDSTSTRTCGWNPTAGDWGNRAPHVVAPPPVVQPWGPGWRNDSVLHAVWGEFAQTAVGQWVAAHAPWFRIASGVLEVLAGLSLAEGTCGGAVFSARLLMANGADQIWAGINDLANGGSPTMSLFEYLGYKGARGLGFNEETSQVVGQLTPLVLSIAAQAWGSMFSCFAAGTPLLTPEGEKPIEKIRPGDWVLAAPEDDPEAPPVPRQVEEVFQNYLSLLHLQVGGRTIRTTSEHPFYVRGKGWTAAKELQGGDELRCHDGRWMAVESITPGGDPAAVYNLRVAEHHTYFVGSRAWGFSVWAHNTCFKIQDGVRARLRPARRAWPDWRWRCSIAAAPHPLASNLPPWPSCSLRNRRSSLTLDICES